MKTKTQNMRPFNVLIATLIIATFSLVFFSCNSEEKANTDSNKPKEKTKKDKQDDEDTETISNSGFTKILMNFSLFENTEAFWKEYEVEMDNEIKQKLFLGDKKPKNEKYHNDDRYLDSLHPFHLNNDNLIDYIYYGHSGSESNFVEIAIDKGEKFEIVFSEFGDIKNILRVNPDSPLIVFFEQKGCCDIKWNYLQQLTLIKGAENLEIQQSDKIFFYARTEFPKKYTNNEFFTIQKANCKLRTNSGLTSKYGKENDFGEYQEEANGYALATVVDEKGERWWFVVMNNTSYSVILDKAEVITEFRKNTKWCGWINNENMSFKAEVLLEPKRTQIN
ncbi:MAG: hypothetical protein JXR58_08735 [Bacteroidales bacterium]|nr:hypothetical protein [Bacteroidales bacterium]